MTDDGNRDRQSGYPAEKARQGSIVLRSKLRRRIFIGGLVALVLVLLLLRLLAG